LHILSSDVAYATCYGTHALSTLCSIVLLGSKVVVAKVTDMFSDM